ncbi:hypothetical protein [Nocardia asiatica]|uniref:hypothetical protein n=1 Tax=Nocardia asiatica TaxID=209252 RepID=UPI00031385C5|nr:hypothetical protein [Nocardia asiatica]
MAVGITTTGRPVFGWAAAAAGSVAQLLNHLAAPQVPSADLLTTQNYLDALCGAVVLAAFALTIGSASDSPRCTESDSTERAEQSSR